MSEFYTSLTHDKILQKPLTIFVMLSILDVCEGFD